MKSSLLEMSGIALSALGVAAVVAGVYLLVGLPIALGVAGAFLILAGGVVIRAAAMTERGGS